MAKEPTSVARRIWVDEQWFINVDDRGYVTGDSFEGALGCVIQLQDYRNPTHKRALKIPRLLADTVRENAYICTLTENEVTNVQKASQGGAFGLIRSLGGEEPLKGRRWALKDAPTEDGREQA